eukprot:GHVT01102642.1.p1 GENE.GHVT01102642.1~~GHVT01102642.1.p1  ORF type:complete len:165 (-),score=24.49 GHVT01102642.1:133-627(-)
MLNKLKTEAWVVVGVRFVNSLALIILWKFVETLTNMMLAANFFSTASQQRSSLEIPRCRDGGGGGFGRFLDDRTRLGRDAASRAARAVVHTFHDGETPRRTKAHLCAAGHFEEEKPKWEGQPHGRRGQWTRGHRGVSRRSKHNLPQAIVPNRNTTPQTKSRQQL